MTRVLGIELVMYGADTEGVENDANTWYKMLYTCILTLTFCSGAIWWSCEAIRAQ